MRVLEGEVNRQAGRFVKGRVDDRPEPDPLMLAARQAEAEAEAVEALGRFDEILAKLNV